jgi:hypothetical protein
MRETRGSHIGKCPFCRKDFGYTMDASGSPDGLSHAMPMCEKFKQMEPQDFVREARNAMQAKKNVS